MTDLIPTLCHLAEWPVPENTEGAILYQALEDPGLKQNELEKTREKLERYKNAYNMSRGLTHSCGIDDLDEVE